MKKLLYTFLAVSLIFSACEEDTPLPAANNNANNNNSIVGNWQLNQVNEGNGLEPFNEYFVWELYSDGTGLYKYSEDGTLPGAVTFDIIWEVTAANVLRLSADGGQDWEEEEILNQTSSELWTYNLDWEEENRYLKIP